MNNKNIQPDTLNERNAPATENELLQAQIQDMQPEIHLLKETINALKRPLHDQKASLKQGYKYNDMRKKITKLFCENKGYHGYHRIYELLNRKGVVLSEKIVRRIMQEEGLAVKSKKRRTYNSYQDEISMAIPNV